MHQGAFSKGILSLSPLLFIIAMEALNGLMAGAKELQLFEGVEIRKGTCSIEVSHLFFADDVLIFYPPKVETLLYLRCLLFCFQAIPGLNINMNKSEVVKVGGDGNGSRLARVLGCKASQLPIKYLGVSLEAKFKDVGS